MAVESYREMFSEFSGRFDAESHFLHVVLPSIVRPGEPFALRAVMMSASGMPDEHYRGRIALEASDATLGVPEAIEFSEDGLGSAVLEGLVAEKEGAFYVTARPDGCPGQPPRSNPVLVRSDGPLLYWGDIHVHTLVSNCHPDLCKSPDFAYWYARRVALLDFCAAADHLRGIRGEPGNWEEIKGSARRHNAPGDFVTFVAFESSHPSDLGGDNNIYYPAADAPHFWVDREDMWGTAPRVGLDELWGFLDRQGLPYISIPHHTGRAGKYRDFELPFHNPRRETVLEIFSQWGDSEARDSEFYLQGGKTDRRAYWRDALELGYRYGVIGSSDTHHTMPGTPYPVNAENYHYAHQRLNCQGVAAIYADRLERASLFDALLGRQCYASTFWRPVIEFSVSDCPMGREARADASLAQRRVIQAKVVTSGPAVATLLRNNEAIASESISEPVGCLEFSDGEPLEKLCIRDAPNSPAPFVFYYLKVRSRKGQVAWSSPIWITL